METTGVSNPKFLKWCFVAAQFMLLLVTIPNVGSFFGAYDLHSAGPHLPWILSGLTAGDLKHLLTGVAIDGIVVVTTMAAMNRYEASRRTWELIPHALIILVMATYSAAANYEDAAMVRPAQYEHISFWQATAWTVNPILVAALPFAVVLMNVLVPSILARPRIKTAREIEMETAEREKRIEAEARIKAAKARANAAVRGEQLRGMAATAAAAKEQGLALLGRTKSGDGDDTPDGPGGGGLSPNGGGGSRQSGVDGDTDPAARAVRIPRGERQAMRNERNERITRTPTWKRVKSSGYVTVSELVELLGEDTIAVSTAREIVRNATGAERMGTAANSGYRAPVESLLRDLRTAKNLRYRALAVELEDALKGPRRRQRAVDSEPVAVASVTRIQPPTLRVLPRHDGEDEAAAEMQTAGSW